MEHTGSKMICCQNGTGLLQKKCAPCCACRRRKER
nr:MAG TPA: Cytochrome C oxidase copper chaperone [Caudoviricetes sp.]